MSLKDNIKKVYEYLKDPVILDLLGLTDQPEEVIDERISKTKQLSNPADNKPRLAIWEEDPRPFNRKVALHTLHVDIIVPLELQQGTGICYDLAENIKRVLKGKPIGTGLIPLPESPDASSGFGWYRASVLFTYNWIS